MSKESLMPGYKSHLLGGTLVFAALYHTAIPLVTPSPLNPFLLLSVTLLGALIPDLDISSKIQRIFYFLTIPLFLFFLFMHQWNNLLMLSGVSIAIGILRHRTILHHPLFLAALPLPAIYLLSKNNISSPLIIQAAIFFVGGAWSHLLLDFGFRLRRKSR